MSSQSKKRKYLKWFEEVFVHVSVDDQALQIEEFQNAIHTDRVSATIDLHVFSVHIQCVNTVCV